MLRGTRVMFGKHSEGGRGVYRIGSRRELRDAWRTRMTSWKMVLGPALGDVEGGFRYVRHFSKESFGLTFGTRGVFRRKDRRVWFESVSKEDFRGDGFRGRWHSPKDGPAGVSAESFGRRHSARLRVGSGRLIGRASGTRVIFRKGSEGVHRSAFEGASGRLLRRVAQGR